LPRPDPEVAEDIRIIPFLQGDTGAEADGGGNDVVAALPHVDRIVRMDGAAGTLTRQVYDDFVKFILLLVPDPVWNTSTGNCRRSETAGSDNCKRIPAG